MEALMGPARTRHFTTVAALVAALVPLSACSVDVREDVAGGERKAVDIRTPVGAMSVRTGVDTPATGLAVYPGATPLRDGDGPQNADVTIGSGRFGLKVIATKFQTADGANAVLGHYRNAMRAYGDVVECRGEIDFEGRPERPVCNRRLFSREMQLAVSREGGHRVVAVKPGAHGSEFSVVYIQAQS
jgi:hypothetical protein